VTTLKDRLGTFSDGRRFARVDLGRRRSPFTILIAVLAIAVALLVIYPLIRMAILVVTEGGTAWTMLTQQVWFVDMLVDTAVVVVLASVISVLLAALLAWITERTDARVGVIGEALPLVPLLLPTVATAMGWVILTIPDAGFLNGFLEALGLPGFLNIYSMPGLIFVYVMILVPYAYLPILAAFRTLDPSLEEAARVSGAKPLKVLMTVAVPAVAPAMLGGLVLVSAVALSLFSVPVIIAVRPEIEMLALRIVSSVRGRFPPAYDMAALLSIILLVALLGLWFLQQRSIKAGRYGKIGGRSAGAKNILRLGKWKWPLRSLLFIYIACSAVLPIAALVVVSFQPYWSGEVFSTFTLDNYIDILGRPLGLGAVWNTAVQGIVTGGIIVLVATALMIYSHRRKSPLGRFAEVTAKIPAAVTNTVFAVAFILALAGPPFKLGGTHLILALAYFVVYLPFAAIATESSVAQIDRSLEEASALSGASEGRTFWRVLMPLVIPGAFAAWALVFVRIVGDLSLPVMLATPRTAVVGFLLIDTWEAGSFGIVAALALIMTLMTIPVVMLMLRLGNPKWRRAGDTRADRRRSRRGRAEAQAQARIGEEPL
jgi:iron(III) transport system permease protein